LFSIASGLTAFERRATAAKTLKTGRQRTGYSGLPSSIKVGNLPALPYYKKKTSFFFESQPKLICNFAESKNIGC
jgi:hypothetical protein